MHDYELTLIIKPEVTDENLPVTIDKIKGLVTGKGGEVGEIKMWGRRKLAYPIKQCLEGNYILTRIKMEPTATAGLESGLKLSEEILRYLLVRLDKRG